MPNATFIFSDRTEILQKGSFARRAPSNIALVKYWGKHAEQLPKNPSLSFTLSQCATETKLSFEPIADEADEVEFSVNFEGKPAESFRPKIASFFKRISPYSPFIKDYKFTIDTHNSFPHSSGIASSASGMAALALCIMDIEAQLNPKIPADYFLKKAGFLARLGSGSASRSVSGPIMIWGKHPAISGSTDEFAITSPFAIHPVFETYQDNILLVDKGKKQVGSSHGHQLMDGHPFAKSRFDQANNNLEKLIPILKNGEIDDFINIVESEALTLHAMMMTSNPHYILMRPATLKIIETLWQFRRETGNKLCFTLDAGANVHLLYPKSEKKTIDTLVKTNLSQYCENNEHISDRVGKGPISQE